jgi:hypothetical protein
MLALNPLSLQFFSLYAAVGAMLKKTNGRLEQQALTLRESEGRLCARQEEPGGPAMMKFGLPNSSFIRARLGGDG